MGTAVVLIKEELEQLATERVELHMSGASAVCLMGALQLALRHPEFDGQAAVIARYLAKELEERLCRTPGLAEVAKRGWG